MLLVCCWDPPSATAVPTSRGCDHLLPLDTNEWTKLEEAAHIASVLAHQAPIPISDDSDTDLFSPAVVGGAATPRRSPSPVLSPTLLEEDSPGHFDHRALYSYCCKRIATMAADAAQAAKSQTGSGSGTWVTCIGKQVFASGVVSHNDGTQVVISRSSFVGCCTGAGAATTRSEGGPGAFAAALGGDES